MLNQSKTFRPLMQQLGQLKEVGARMDRMVLSTATLPSVEERMWKRMRCACEDVSDNTYI
jgi:hypothetical protein